MYLVKKVYARPEIQIRKYDLTSIVFTGMLSNITDGGTWEDEWYDDETTVKYFP